MPTIMVVESQPQFQRLLEELLAPVGVVLVVDNKSDALRHPLGRCDFYVMGDKFPTFHCDLEGITPSSVDALVLARQLNQYNQVNYSRMAFCSTDRPALIRIMNLIHTTNIYNYNEELAQDPERPMSRLPTEIRRIFEIARLY